MNVSPALKVLLVKNVSLIQILFFVIIIQFFLFLGSNMWKYKL